MEDKSGRSLAMKKGQMMETKDDEKIMMKGNEVWRLEKRQDIHRGVDALWTRAAYRFSPDPETGSAERETALHRLLGTSPNSACQK